LPVYLLAENQSDSDKLRLEVNAKVKQYKNLKTSSNDTSKLFLLKNIGANYQRLNNFDSAIYYYTKGATLAKEVNNLEFYSSIVYNLSLVNLRIGNYQQALNYALDALAYDRKLGNAENLAASLNSVALIYQEWGIYDKSLAYRLESIKISEESNNLVEIANGNYNLGSLYLKIGKQEQALKYFELAKNKYETLLVETPTELNLKQGLSESIYSIGGIYIYKQEYQKALTNFNRALQIKNTIGDKVGIGNCYYQIGLTNFLENNYETSIQNLFQALQYKNLVADKKGLALVYFRIGSVYYHQAKLTQAETFLRKSIPEAQEINDKEVLRESYKILYQLYNGKKKYKEALTYHKLFKAYTDSILNEHTIKTVEEISIRYETDKKEKENVILQRDNEIQTLTIQKQKSLGFYLIGVIVLVVSILIILYLLYRSKRKTNKIISYKNTLLGKQNAQIAKQKHVIEEKNLHLTDSIQYAKRIQNSMLSDVLQLNNVLNDAFILFKPKDIVSGDFYWFGEKDGKFIIAAIDCTGHGVPGAFMSMLGNSFLNQIVLNKGITAPDIILKELSQEVQIALKQEETNNRDGMDMALCTIDLKTNQVEFAGAKNPLIFIQQKNVERIKGDKAPIGYSHYNDTPFHKHQINCQESTCLYLFSDGYIDQFGGPNGRKFMIKQFQSLLEEIHEKPMAQQKEILDKHIEDWMKNEDQIDDILVIGFKIGN
jgi:serine phosphatase RsbU (regulator of sigma subunit)